MWLRLRQIALVAEKLEPVVDDLREVLGIEVCYRDPGVERFGLENALFPIGNQFLEVVAPIREGTAGGRYLERRGGDGGYMVITQCDDHAPRRKRVEELGIRLAHQFEVPGHFKNMQLHPRDTGGSFFEIDEQLGDRAHDPDGPWDPAGGDGWKEARRLDRVSAILAAEIQSPSPRELAERWAAIAQVRLEKDGAGNPVMPLDGAAVRFVPLADDRGEGLAGLDLEAVDRRAILEAARARGCYRDDSQVYICGMRMNLV
jgi:hypothetical protein